MPKSKYRGRGKILRYRTVKLGKKKYLRCAIMSKKGKHGGRTICEEHRRKRR